MRIRVVRIIFSDFPNFLNFLIYRFPTIFQDFLAFISHKGLQVFILLIFDTNIRMDNNVEIYIYNQ